MSQCYIQCNDHMCGSKLATKQPLSINYTYWYSKIMQELFKLQDDKM